MPRRPRDEARSPKLQQMLDRFNELSDSHLDDWRDDNPSIEALNVAAIMQRDPRQYPWPREIVRDYLLRYLISNKDGPDTADAVMRLAPNFIEWLTEFYVEALEALAPDRERASNPPPAGVHELEHLAVTAAVLRARPAEKSHNAACVQAGIRFGIDRGKVQYSVRWVLNEIGKTDPDMREAMLCGLAVMMGLIDQYDAGRL